MCLTVVCLAEQTKMERKGPILMTGVTLVPHIMEGTKRKVSNGCFGGQFKNKVHLLSVFHAVEYELVVSSMLGSTISEYSKHFVLHSPKRADTESDVLVFSIVAK